MEGTHSSSLKEALSKSRKVAALTQSGGPSSSFYGIESLKRKTQNIEESTRNLLERTSHVSQDNTGALRILSRHNIDADALNFKIKKIRFADEYKGEENFEEADIDKFLTYHQDMMILSSINESRRSSERDFYTSHLRWLSNVFYPNRKKFWQQQSLDSWDALDSSKASSPAESNANAKTSLINSNGSMRSFSSESHGKYSCVVSLFSTLHEMAEEVSLHAGQVTTLLPCTLLFNIGQDLANEMGRMKPSDLPYFRSMLSILSNWEHGTTSGLRVGHFNPLWTQSYESCVPLWLNYYEGLLIYYQNSFWDFMQHEIQEVEEDANRFPSELGKMDSEAVRIASYVRHHFQSSSTSSTSSSTSSSAFFNAKDSSDKYTFLSSSQGEPLTSFSTAQTPILLWPFVYHCLRVGSIQTAWMELDRLISQGRLRDEGSQSLFHLLTMLNDSRRGSPTEGSVQEDRSLEVSFETCRREYQNLALQSEKLSTSQLYQKMVLNLISLSDSEDGGNEFLEDFIWWNLWFHFTFLMYGQRFPMSMDRKPTSLTSFANDLPALQNYLDSEDDQPFFVAQVLFSGGLFGPCLHHLLHHGKSEIALILVSLLTYLGLVSPDLSSQFQISPFGSLAPTFQVPSPDSSIAINILESFISFMSTSFFSGLFSPTSIPSTNSLFQDAFDKRSVSSGDQGHGDDMKSLLLSGYAQGLWDYSFLLSGCTQSFSVVMKSGLNGPDWILQPDRLFSFQALSSRLFQVVLTYFLLSDPRPSVLPTLPFPTATATAAATATGVQWLKGGSLESYVLQRISKFHNVSEIQSLFQVTLSQLGDRLFVFPSVVSSLRWLSAFDRGFDFVKILCSSTLKGLVSSPNPLVNHVTTSSTSLSSSSSATVSTASSANPTLISFFKAVEFFSKLGQEGYELLFGRPQLSPLTPLEVHNHWKSNLEFLLTLLQFFMGTSFILEGYTSKSSKEDIFKTFSDSLVVLKRMKIFPSSSTHPEACLKAWIAVVEEVVPPTMTWKLWDRFLGYLAKLFQICLNISLPSANTTMKALRQDLEALEAMAQASQAGFVKQGLPFTSKGMFRNAK